MATKNKHVVVGLSGGVDSAVAALKLIEDGYRVKAVFMKNWEEDDDAEYCAAEEDLREARAVCEVLDIPLKTVNFSAEYWDRVFQHFLQEYRAGRTPNPDVLCNKEIKFKAFLEYALSLGADRLATGHYAGLRRNANGVQLIKARDENKDQSYFLSALDQEQLQGTLFPLSELTKPEVRTIAKAAGLPNCERKDSTGICFIGERRFKDFLQQYLPGQPGEIRTLDEEVKGQHQGLMYHTIGQRQGLGLGGPGGPWFVVGKDMARNILYVVEGDEHPALYNDRLIAMDPHWIAGTAPDLPFPCKAKIRYRQQEQVCTVAPHTQGLEVRFDTPQRAITPGQYVVFYRGDVCLGSGIIQRVPKQKTSD
ncbi:MAG: tRNA 2-thiouridine(34) synthase MnmA [Gammaproteobacteria bacterium]|nr:MAG: tRNA 2-thiouridine(34) synthase MnmA [Gammaproteobacteria bacterium]